MTQPIPVIDIFAGPGGLGEGFSSLKKHNKQVFKLALSIEKENSAYQTLLLRSIFRSFESSPPQAYYDYITGEISKAEFQANKHIAERLYKAKNEAKNVTLGDTDEKEIDKWIKSGIGKSDKWVLIGGPPCQAYSTIGRAKMMNSDLEKYKKDSRHLLYKEYLRIIEIHRPPVFIMENVKGILSSQLNGELIFNKIIHDLSSPKKGLNYEIRSLCVDTDPEELRPKDFIIESEKYGIPQSRHRVILFGVRKDLADKKHSTLKIEKEKVTIREVLSPLPRIRSKLSKQTDLPKSWIENIEKTNAMIGSWRSDSKDKIIASMRRNQHLAKDLFSTGSSFIEDGLNQHLENRLSSWLEDPKLGGVIQHESKSHMNEDIQRYFFLSNCAKILGRSPKLTELPKKLMPKHQNASANGTKFLDRFRVQLFDHPSTTIVSHIAKDGHYYIHPDPSQARSFTVREAARLQTFPDNYFFEGPKTAQYTQVGNAVPPLLAKKIAEIIYQFLN